MIYNKCFLYHFVDPKHVKDKNFEIFALELAMIKHEVGGFLQVVTHL